MERKNKKNGLLISMMLCLVLLLAACSNNGNSTASNASTPTPAPQASSTTPAETTPPATDESGIDWEARKALNAAAGEITYITGYYYAASPPDIQAVVADELGYFEELGLNVNIMPGLDFEGMRFLAAGQAQIASAGTPSLVIQSSASGADISGVATFGSVGTSALLVMSDSGIEGPADLEGKTVGFHGAMPANMLAMFKNAGVDPMKVKGVSIGYDPTVLSNGSVDALTIYKSNEPYKLQQLGEDVTIIDPGQYGAETSFGVVVVNNDFAKKHPTAVEDYLRAITKAHEYAVANPDTALLMLSSKSESVYDIPSETNRWAVEREIIESSRHAGFGVGYQTVEQWQREIDMLFDAAVITEKVDVEKVMNNSFIEAIFEEETVIWPE